MKRAMCAFLLAAAALGLFVRGARAQDFRYFLDTTITTTYGPDYLCYNRLRNKLYLSVSDTVLGIIDGQYNYSTVSGFNWSYPRYPEYNPNRDVVYACGTYEVFVISGATNAIVDSSVMLSEGFDGLLYDSTSNRLYAGGGGMSILDGTSDSLLKSYSYYWPFYQYRPSDKVLAVQYTYDTLYMPQDTFLMVLRDTLVLDSVSMPGLDNQSRFAANEARGKIYVSMPALNQVRVVSATTHAVIGTVPLPAGPSAMAYCPTSDEVYVACQGSYYLTAIHGAADSVTYIYLGVAGDSVSAVIYNRFIDRIFYADYNSGTVGIINPLTKAIEGTVVLPVGGAPPHPVALQEGDSGKVFTANSWTTNVCVVAWQDTTIPYILWTAPYDSATDITFDQPVTIQFSEPIVPASLAFTCFPDPGGWTAEWDASFSQVTLRHRFFATNTQHTITVTAASDPWGNALAAGGAPNPWRFTVRPLETVSSPWSRGRYQLMSVPIRLYDSLAVNNFSDDLGAYGQSNWRLFGYEPASASNVETPPLMLGRGYWLSSVNSCTLDAAGYRLPPASMSVIVGLGTGWNLIGDPVDIPFGLGGIGVLDAINRPWSDTTTNTLVRQRTWVYTDTTLDFQNNGRWDIDTLTPVDPADSLQPWKGYAVYATAPCSLEIANMPARYPAKAGPSATFDWRLTLAAECGGAWDHVSLGSSPQALPGYDRLDGEKPPPVSDAVTLFIPHGDWGPGTWHQYASDFRPAGDYMEWPLSLELADQTAEARIGFKLEGGLPRGHRLYLVERDNMRAVEITGGGQVGYTGDRELAVVLSNRGPGDLPFTPLSFALGLPRPNPAYQTARLDYQITRAGSVKLTVFNVLGQRVRTLVDGTKQPGYYTAAWDGRDDRMRASPPGVYFVWLEAEGRQAARKLVRVR